MSRNSEWTNADGLVVGFGARDSKNPNAATVRTQGNVCIMQFPFDYDTTLEIGTDVPSSKSIPVPAGSTIKRAQLAVDTAFVGGTNIDFGFMNAAGTAIDDDGLDAAVATAALTAGAVITMDGALIGASVGAADAYFGVVTTGTYTAGDGVITIEYILPMPDSTPTDPISGIVGSL